MSFTVTATQGGSTATGMRAMVKVLTGQAASPAGQTAGTTSTTPSLALTGTTSGSLVYGSNLGFSGTYTANAASTYQNNQVQSGLECISLRSLSTVAGGTVTLGGTATANSISVSLLEILAGSGLAEDASGPAAFGGAGITAASASFSPPAGSLLVLTVQSNGAAGVVTMTVTDTSGLGMAWTEQVKQNGSGKGYSGAWTTTVPAVITAQPLVAPSPAAIQAASW